MKKIIPPVLFAAAAAAIFAFTSPVNAEDKVQLEAPKLALIYWRN